ncbi:MAG: hypothetical protein QGF67_19175 [Lentisphaeria bacterium]|nr:hypothetical protein [Lentisphaeria bacterium]MDP7743571.1 hypothetical protein [Lentisphaeria bacterium]
MKDESAEATHHVTPGLSSNVETASANSQSRTVEIFIAVGLAAICLYLIGNCCHEMRLQSLRDFDRLPPSQQPNFSVSFLTEAMQAGDLTTKIAAINAASANRRRCADKVLMIAATDPDRWVRMYLVSVLRHTPHPANPALYRVLQRDSDPVVVAAAGELVEQRKIPRLPAGAADIVSSSAAAAAASVAGQTML